MQFLLKDLIKIIFLQENLTETLNSNFNKVLTKIFSFVCSLLMMENKFVLNEICRLCLSSKDKNDSLVLLNITELLRNKFQELTQIEVKKKQANKISV